MERIEFAGFKNPVPYYQESSIFCMTSNHEGWGLVLTEAMQYGCVPIAFDSFESIHEIIQNKENGFLVKPFQIQEYVKILIDITNTDISTYSQCAIDSMERLKPNQIIKEWMALFKQTI